MRNLLAVVFSLLFLTPVWANDYYNADYNEQKDIYDIDFILKHDINHKLYSKINIERK